ncbi:MAG TPA: hypothetical protein VKA43_02570 [Gammaproteobacteria bacterium]|nr:hypothetical protein [Gammaproteobacteria bacterium]
MRRLPVAPLIVAAAVLLIAVWVAVSTEWGEITLPAPLRGEAASNPFYAAERLVAMLGATSERREALGDTSPSAVVVLSTWGWDIDAARRDELESWVEAGGRLVVDAALVSGSDAFERWSGITRARDEELAAEDEDVIRAEELVEPCEWLYEISYEAADVDDEPAEYQVCDLDRSRWLESSEPLQWALGDDETLQVVRVAVGEGGVTVINAVPFVYREIFAGDHGPLLVAATQLRAGDHVVFMSEENVSSLLALVWRHGAPVVTVLLFFIALALWRGAMRFGPLIAPVERARRSLGEQILGTGRFVARVGEGAALHAAAVRALHEAAVRRIGGYERLSPEDRTAAVARLAAVDAGALGAALDLRSKQRSLELKGTLGLLESARRQLIVKNQWSKHGKRI